ncbi:MAG: arylsulfotransferase family protein [Paracoccaceae bacterium]
MFRKVELWVAVLVGLLGILFAVLVSGAALLVERGKTGLGVIGRVAHAVAEVPVTAEKVLTAKDTRIYPQSARFDAIPTGWSFGGAAAGPRLPGYLLVSRIDGERQRHVVELTSLADWTVRHAWVSDPGAWLEGAPRDTRIGSPENWTPETYRMVHPWLQTDGGLVFKDHYGPLVATDACGKLRWRIDEPLFSHATEVHAEGNFWIPAHPKQPPNGKWPQDFREDTLAEVSPDGRILWSRSLPELFEEKGLKSILFPVKGYDPDPVHLNDIEPVLSDGPYWKKGDLFLSMRGPSAVLLYRPSTDEIVWFKSGPWLRQHDVDILDDHRISVFSNNTVNYGKGDRVADASEVMIYDFATDAVTSPWKDRLKELKVMTTFEGLSDILPGGDIFIEEENSGRLVVLSPDGAVRAQYVNRAPDGTVYRMGWSRWVTQERGDAALKALAATACPVL